MNTLWWNKTFLWLGQSPSLSTCWNVHFHDSFWHFYVCCMFLSSIIFHRTMIWTFPYSSFIQFIYLLCCFFTVNLWAKRDHGPCHLHTTDVCLFVCLFVCVFLFLFLFTFHDDIVNTDQRPWGMRLNVQWEKEWKSLKRKLLNLNHQRPCHSLVYRLSSSGTYFLYLHISRLVYFVPSFF